MTRTGRQWRGVELYGSRLTRVRLRTDLLKPESLEIMMGGQIDLVSPVGIVVCRGARTMTYMEEVLLKITETEWNKCEGI